MINASQLLATNQFVYCLNHPVKLVDPTGFTFEDLQAESKFDHDSPNSEWSASGGGNIWSSFKRSLQAAADGLNMAVGKRNLPSIEKHHLLTNKNRNYSPLYEEVVNRYEMDLNDPVNIIEVPGHKGRHPNSYHNFMLDSIRELDSLANGNTELFNEGFEIIREFFSDNMWLLYAK